MANILASDKPIFQLEVLGREQEQCQAKVRFSVGTQTLELYLKRARRAYAKRLKLPGFRKGKVPAEMLEQYVSREELLEIALDELAPDAIGELLKQTPEDKLSSTPKVELDSTEEPVTLVATLPLKPEVDLGDYNQIKFKSHQHAVDEGQLAELLEQIKLSKAVWNRVEAPLVTDDLAVLSIDGQVDQKTFFERRKAEFWLSPENRSPLPGFSQQLEGLRRGERRRFELTIPEGYQPTEHVGRNAKFSVVLHSVKRREAPELNDRFAASLGDKNITTLEGLKTHLRQRLKQRSQTEYEDQLRTEFVERLTELTKFTLAPLMLDNELARQLRSIKARLKNRKTDLDAQLKHEGTTLEQFETKLRAKVETQIKQSLAVARLTEDLSPEVDADEVQKELDQLRQRGTDNSRVDWDATRQSIRQNMAERNSIQQMVDKITSEDTTSQTAQKSLKVQNQ